MQINSSTPSYKVTLSKEALNAPAKAMLSSSRFKDILEVVKRAIVYTSKSAWLKASSNPKTVAIISLTVALASTFIVYANSRICIAVAKQAKAKIKSKRAAEEKNRLENENKQLKVKLAAAEQQLKDSVSKLDVANTRIQELQSTAIRALELSYENQKEKNNRIKANRSGTQSLERANNSYSELD